MICYPKLGRLGRLGNYLFQIAATIGTARALGESYGFPHWQHEKDFQLAGCFFDMLPPGRVYKELRYQYDPVPDDHNLQLYGFFQSEKYFAHCSDEIRSLLTPRLKSAYMPATASVHIRRGDYLLLQDKHPILGMDYYARAMTHMREQGISSFVIFSDDLPWCRQQAWPEDVRVIKDAAPLHQLAQTIACEAHILANSTFSWWGAWLDPRYEKKVVAPRDWYGPGYRDEFPTKDLIPEGWVQI